MHPTLGPKVRRAYGDRDGDGMVQLSFTLELPPSGRAREAAKRFAEAHGLAEPIVATMEECAEGFSFFVVYGRSRARGRGLVHRCARGADRSPLSRRDRAPHPDPSRAENRRSSVPAPAAMLTRSGSTRSSTTRATRATRGSRATRASRSTIWAPRSKTSSSPHARGRSEPTPSSSARSSPSATATRRTAAPSSSRSSGTDGVARSSSSSAAREWTTRWPWN